MKLYIYLFIALIVAGYTEIVSAIKRFFTKYRSELIFSGIILSALLPLLYSLQSGWEMPELLIFYVFIVLFGGLLMGIGWAGRDDYDREDDRNNRGYNSNPNYNYTNSYYNPQAIEKRKNGGITDKELNNRKKMIRKNLEKKKLLEQKEQEENAVT